ncbi:helix-turn-helix domain-containing protein [Nocardia macrotermitis]|uniref:DUF5753 domain-containing protein n=1 Tax=Nocardia macrotermitis TaxID=2585198 RepID=A0A7K0CV92_9NOCA|nr:helix-turn-helix transcriptional regulator [Nocardia macrotermitis]MQY17429.1 hypothetical protein [Nocardia macrotermitis]
MAPVSPTAARWEIVAWLRARREEHGFTGPAIAKELQFTSTYWSKVENDKKLLVSEKFEHLLDMLEFPEDEQEYLRSLRQAAVGTGWWSQYNKIFSPQSINWFGLEFGAEEVRSYESLLIPGLLQTEAYARSLVEADQIGIPAKEVQRRVALRMKRQERLFDDDPLRLVAVMSQAAIEQQIGGPRVLREQLLRIARALKDHPDTIDIRVVPFTSRTGPIIGGCTFHILDFPSSKLGPLAWYEWSLASSIIEDPDKIFDLDRLFQHVQNQALDRADSLALIEESAGKLDKLDE